MISDDLINAITYFALGGMICGILVGIACGCVRL